MKRHTPQSAKRQLTNPQEILLKNRDVNTATLKAEARKPKPEARLFSRSPKPASSAMWNHRRPIQQELGSRDNHLVAGLDAILNLKIIAHRLPDLQRLLPRQIRPPLLRFGHKGEVLPRQPRNRSNQ